ncbi:MAG: hypothetical protein KAS18_07290, partial [Calditrichia bacterium]|nr:hypothetical protein [Calditrichia bacterium]
PITFNKVLPITWFFRFIQEPRRLFKPIIVSILNFVFLIYPILILRHILGIERNPSIVKHLKIKIQK